MSNLADGVFKVALPLLAIRYTRSPALVAGVQLVQMAPWLLGALPIGAVVDRIDRRRAMMAANAARAVLVAVPAVLIAFDAGGLWLLFVAAAGTGVAEVFYDTAAQSMLPSPRPQGRPRPGQRTAVRGRTRGAGVRRATARRAAGRGRARRTVGDVGRAVGRRRGGARRPPWQFPAAA